MKKIAISLLALSLTMAPLTQVAHAEESVLKQNPELGQGFYAVTDTNRPMLRAATNPPVFLADIKKGSVDSWDKHSVLPSITGAQAVLESGWGTSQLSTMAHNLFGVKGTYNGSFVTMPTQEYVNGKWITIDAQFRKYPSKNESMTDHGDFLQKSRYQDLIGETNYVKAANYLQKAGYATDPDYAKKLVSIIEARGLTAWDQEAFDTASLKNAKWRYARETLNIRSAASWDSSIAFKITPYYAAQLNYGKQENGFIEVIYQGKRGWYKPSLSLYWYDKNPTTKYVTTNNVNFRTAEKWDSPVAQSKKAGQSVLVLRKMPKSGWLEVVLTNSVIGYIPDSPNYVKKS
ncbi:glucosaminidase domain-containing protein [Listeria fleischmannii]|uniref:glucosaminidase domain-containing protein n=2 Tax=Listeria fleischmannii TaxID=1069827 RepID=UPI000E0005F1|nr:glucosaminidase domain-containing protein [Listeria fleischmannii]STY35128.1 Exo-glucosaminidase lytG precursor [Listeria fleischmannii subsp. coloradonensis]